jgi:hypothetical protein
VDEIKLEEDKEEDEDSLNKEIEDLEAFLAQLEKQVSPKSEKAANTRIETQKAELREAFVEDMKNLEAKDDLMIVEYLNKFYVALKYGVSGYTIIGKEKFADYFPNAYEKISQYSDKAGQWVFGTVEEIDEKLESLFGGKYKTSKELIDALLSGVEKNAPPLVADAIKFFTISGVAAKLFGKAGGFKGDWKNEHIEYKKLDRETKLELNKALEKASPGEIKGIFGKLGFDIPEEAIKKVPEFDWKPELNRDSLGVRWNEYVGKHGQSKNSIRIDKGDPKLSNPLQQIDHVRVNSNGKVIGRDGKEISSRDYKHPSDHPNAHIPLSEWRKWKQWNKP